MQDQTADNARRIKICEVGPRDGLQNHPHHFEVEERVELVNRLFAAGLPRVEAVSFVNDKRVPRMAGAEAVVAGAVRGKNQLLSGLVLNRRGVERALATSLDELRFVVVSSETFSQRNQGASVEEMLRTCEEFAADVRAAGKRFSVIIATAFGCPFEGRIAHETIADIVSRLSFLNLDELVLADTIGAATPFEVTQLLTSVMPLAATEWGCHFHNTRNMGFANALASIACGVTVLDSSIGGLGGCPFAPRATGNIATEELVYMLAGAGHSTLPDLDALLDTVAFVEGRIGAPAPGMLAKAGRFPPVASADTGA